MEKKGKLQRVQRVFLVVLDSVGVGQLPDAHLYGDEGSNTLGNVARSLEKGLVLPNLGALGIGNLTSIPGTPPSKPLGICCKMAERSPGKDTTTGHWEIAGVTMEEPFRTYPGGFPPEIVLEFERRIGRKILGNKPASGTEIIQELGPEHVATGRPIVYTSADSVFQIACHEEVVPLETLYRWCRAARELFSEPTSLARVIARPFVGPVEIEPARSGYVRTANRKDFSVPPPRPTLLDYAQESGVTVTAIGKIQDIFAGRGIDRAVHTESNRDGVEAVLSEMRQGHHPEPSGVAAVSPGRQLVIANLVDFDMLYGHRNDPEGYARALVDFDRAVPSLLNRLGPEDVLIITADHGCDPTTVSTDHSREYVPALMAGPRLRRGLILPERTTFADLGATVADLLGVDYRGDGTSFAEEIVKDVEDDRYA